MSQRLHANELLDEILRLVEANLKTSLSLVGIYRGTLAWLPPTTLTELVNGVWVELIQSTDFAEVAMPKGLTVTYRVRIVYVRRLDISNNIDQQRVADAESIVEMIYDNYKLSYIANGGTLPLSNGEPLWFLPRQVEWQPPEDNFVQAISADLTAVACNTEIVVRTKF
jgi:hypothetical protein